MIAKMFRSSSVRVIVVRTRLILIFRIQNTCTSQDVVTLDIFMKASFYGVTLCFLLAFFTTYWVILIDTHCACDIYHRGGSRFSKGGAQVSIPPPSLKSGGGRGGGGRLKSPKWQKEIIFVKCPFKNLQLLHDISVRYKRKIHLFYFHYSSMTWLVLCYIALSNGLTGCVVGLKLELNSIQYLIHFSVMKQIMFIPEPTAYDSGTVSNYLH